MRDRLTAAFDFKEPPQGLNPQPALWAVHNRTSEKYFLSKSISLYTVNNDEYVGLYGCTDKIKETDIEAVFEQFKRLIFGTTDGRKAYVLNFHCGVDFQRGN